MTFTITPTHIAYVAAMIIIAIVIGFVPWSSVTGYIKRVLAPPEPPESNEPEILDLILLAGNERLPKPVLQWILFKIAIEKYSDWETLYKEATGSKYPRGQQHPLFTPTLPVSDIVEADREKLYEAGFTLPSSFSSSSDSPS